MTEKKRVALIGAGRVVHEAYVPALKTMDDVLSVVAVADPVLSRAEAVRGLLNPGAVVARSATELLARWTDEIDLLIVSTPPVAAVEVLRQTRHDQRVLVEKPFTLDSFTLQPVMELTREHRLSVYVVNNYAWRPDFVVAREIVAQGRIGTCLFGRLHMLADKAWQGIDVRQRWREDRALNPTGVAGDKAYHLVYLAESLSGIQFDDLSVVHRGTFVPNCWAAVGTTGSCVWSLFATWVDSSPPGSDLLEIVGTGGRLSISTRVGEPVILHCPSGRREFAIDAEDGWGYEGMLRAIVLDEGGNSLDNHARLADLMT